MCGDHEKRLERPSFRQPATPGMMRSVDGHAFRRVILRSLRFVAWLVTWPLWKLGKEWRPRDAQMAEDFYDKLVATSTREFGPYHRRTLAAQADHAVALSKLGEFEQAEAELTEVIIRLNAQDDGDARLLMDVRLWHYHVLVELGWLSETEADARFVAEAYARQSGPDHPDALHWRELDAVALWNDGRHDEATAEMADVAARRAATQGATHPDTLRTESTLSVMTSGKTGSFRIRPSAE
jgi:hypothetical protein